MTKNRKILTYTVISIVLIILITAGTILTLNLINGKKSTATVTPTTKTVTTLRDQAETARKQNDKAKATALLTEAKQQVMELPKTDANTNIKVDIDAQLWLLQHPAK
jgi:hypothetical protein